MSALDDVRKAPGVYLLLDLDGEPAYAGQSSNLWKRLRDHLVDQRSDVVTDVLLDVYEVREVVIWYHIKELALPLRTDDDHDPDVMAKRQPLEAMEAALMRRKPRWNRKKSRWSGLEACELTYDNCDLRLPIISDAELGERQKRLRRIEAKLLHLLRAVRKASVSGEPRKALWGLMQHASDLHNICKQGLNRGGRASAQSMPNLPLEFDRESNPTHAHRTARGTPFEEGRNATEGESVPHWSDGAP
jgi:hypothetical protein